MINTIRMELRLVIAGSIMAMAGTVAMGVASSEPSRNSSTTPTQIARLTRNLLLQIDLAYRHNQRIHDARTRTVQRVYQAWKNSAQGTEETALLQAWLQESIRQSAPDQRKPLPPIPEFIHPTQQVRSSPSLAPQVPELRRSPTTLLNIEWPRTPVWIEPWDPSPRVRPARESHAWAGNRNIQRLSSISCPARVRPIVTASMAIGPYLPRPLNGVQPALISAVTSIPNRSHPVQINRDELISRLIGYRHGLRRLEAQLAATETPSARQLAIIAQELEALTEQRELLMLYCTAIGADIASMDSSLRSTSAAWKSMQKAIAARHRTLNESAIPFTTEDRQIEKSILGAIERRMADQGSVGQTIDRP